ncbi:MAG: hypothetical protein JWQ98_3045 [Chlorobi bacterium]|nr:hypothetical protein [Chlorobiota bacterium]
MTLTEARDILEAIEPALPSAPFVTAHTFARDGRALHLALTERFMRRTRKGRVWKSGPLLTALKNAAYGFDEDRARSTGGSDGIFLLDRSFTPRNEMMRKIFDRYLDKPGSGATDVAEHLKASPDDLLAVRLVSHHMRLLGVLHRTRDEDWLVLVDYDDTK